MRGAKSAKWVAGAIIVAMAATACGSSDGKDKSSKNPSGKPEGRTRRTKPSDKLIVRRRRTGKKR